MKSKKALIIFNPVAGNKKLGDPKQMIQEVLKEKKWEYEWFETVKAKRQPLEPFAKKKYDRIIVSGGDGTVAEVCSFLIENKIKTPLVILPQGSANILAVSLFLPMNIRNALEKGIKNEGRTLDAIKINQNKYGMIAVGCGYDTLVMKKTTRNLKRKMGALAYLWTILKTIFWYRSRPYRLTVDGKRHTISAKSIMTFNILPLGHLKITKPFTQKEILPDDSLLNIYVLNPRPFRDLFRFSKGIKMFQGKKISIKSKKKRHFQVDGEVYEGKTLQVEVVPRAVNIVH